jgi:hypothetical protein
LLEAGFLEKFDLAVCVNSTVVFQEKRASASKYGRETPLKRLEKSEKRRPKSNRTHSWTLKYANYLHDHYRGTRSTTCVIAQGVPTWYVTPYISKSDKTRLKRMQTLCEEEQDKIHWWRDGEQLWILGKEKPTGSLEGGGQPFWKMVRLRV